VRLSGAEPAVAAARAIVGGDEFGAAGDFWTSIRDQSHAFFAPARAGGATLWRLSVKSTAPHTDLGGDQLMEWGGALRWLVAGERSDATRLRSWAKTQGGHAIAFRRADPALDPFQPLPDALFALHAKLKAVFDPQGVLNRGRLYKEF
jgi:glycolate oxidase FAD binding subunit